MEGGEESSLSSVLLSCIEKKRPPVVDTPFLRKTKDNDVFASRETITWQPLSLPETDVEMLLCRRDSLTQQTKERYIMFVESDFQVMFVDWKVLALVQTKQGWLLCSIYFGFAFLVACVVAGVIISALCFVRLRVCEVGRRRAALSRSIQAPGVSQSRSARE
jgi:hypothetical protein